LREVGDHEILENDGQGLRNADAFSPVRVPMVPDAPVPLMVMRAAARSGTIVGVDGDIDVEAVGPARQHRSQRAGAIDGDGFGDGQGAEAPGSRQSISPLMNVFEIAPAKVLHGAVRCTGRRRCDAETKVRVAWAEPRRQCKKRKCGSDSANNFDLLCIFNLRLGLRFACFR